MRIRVLPDHVVNQIAAGEVIENAASVVKELLENSLDAGATQVVLEVVGAGRQLVRVADNGCGMSGDDALLSLTRHATSKISTAEDLNKLATLGFRGEALASIAAVSKMRILTAAQEGMGSCVLVAGGQVVEATAVPCDLGTSVEVRALFYNVPARRKFQGTTSRDVAEIAKMVTRLALARPDIRLQVMKDQELWFRFPAAQTLEARVQDVLGKEWIAAAVPLNWTEEQWRVEGFLGLPHMARANRSGQHLFINGRAVVCPLLASAVTEAYASRLMTYRYPVFVLHVTLPPDWVDVNVHPQKHEVRLRFQEVLKEGMRAAVTQALEKGEARLAPKPFQPLMSISPLTLSAKVAEELPLPKPLEPATLFTPSEEGPSYRVLTLLGRYCLVREKMQEAFALVDVSAAEERLLHEQMSRSDVQPEMQALLEPITWHATLEETPLLLEALERLNRVGIALRHLGGETFVIDALAERWEEGEIIDQLRDWLKELPTSEPLTGWPQKMSHARKKAISLEEAQLLIDKLMRTAQPLVSPSGRKIMVPFGAESIARYFERG